MPPLDCDLMSQATPNHGTKRAASSNDVSAQRRSKTLPPTLKHGNALPQSRELEDLQPPQNDSSPPACIQQKLPSPNESTFRGQEKKSPLRYILANDDRLSSSDCVIFYEGPVHPPSYKRGRQEKRDEVDLVSSEDEKSIHRVSTDEDDGPVMQSIEISSAPVQKRQPKSMNAAGGGGRDTQQRTALNASTKKSVGKAKGKAKGKGKGRGEIDG